MECKTCSKEAREYVDMKIELFHHGAKVVNVNMINSDGEKYKLSINDINQSPFKFVIGDLKANTRYFFQLVLNNDKGKVFDYIHTTNFIKKGLSLKLHQLAGAWKLQSPVVLSSGQKVEYVSFLPEKKISYGRTHAAFLNNKIAGSIFCGYCDGKLWLYTKDVQVEGLSINGWDPGIILNGEDNFHILIDDPDVKNYLINRVSLSSEKLQFCIVESKKNIVLNSKTVSIDAVRQEINEYKKQLENSNSNQESEISGKYSAKKVYLITAFAQCISTAFAYCREAKKVNVNYETIEDVELFEVNATWIKNLF